MEKEIEKEFYKIYNDKKQNIVRDQRILDFIHKKLQQERERIIEEIEKIKKEIYNPEEIGKVGTHAIASNQNDGYNQAIDDIIKILNQ